MREDYLQLQYAFQSEGYDMYSDEEVSHKISQKK
jgi:hypothetical protein